MLTFDRMKLPKWIYCIFLCLACESEPVQPGNEPENHVTNFTAMVTSSTTILIKWEDAPNVDKYFVQAKTGTGSFHNVTDGLLNDNDSDWSDGNAAVNVVQNTKQAEFSGLVPATAYEFTIHPYNQGIAPDPDYKTDGAVPTTSASTPVEVTEPQAHVTEFTATALSNASIKVTWSDAAEVHKYLVLAKTGSGTFANVVDGASVADDTDWSDNNGALNILQGTQEAIFNGLIENTDYEFLIYPYNLGGSTDPDFKTDGPVPEASATTSSSSSATFDETLVTEIMINVSGKPFDITSDIIAYKAHPQQLINWSYIPRIILRAQSSGGYSIAWHDEQNTMVKISHFNSDNTQSGTDMALGSNVHALGGFDLLEDSYVVGFVTGVDKETFNVSILDPSGSVVSTTALTGTIGLEELHSKQAPLDFGSSRVRVNTNTNKIGVFLSHKMKWDDGIKHQGALFKFLDFSGNILGGDVEPYADDNAGGDGWFYSHNFDTRLEINGELFTLIGNGDANPRAIPIRLVNSTMGTYTENETLFPISGTSGDNDTKTQLGGFSVLADGTYALTFSSEEGRSTRDVSFMHINASGSSLTHSWLTNYTSDTEGYAVNVKSALYGEYILVAWEEVVNNFSTDYKAMFSIVDINGNFIKEPQQFADMRFNRGDDFVNLADGDVIWATGSGNQLIIYRLDYDATIFN